MALRRQDRYVMLWLVVEGGCHVTCHLHVIFLGSVFGCLWICDEVPDRGVLRQEMAAQVVGGSIF